MGLATVIIEPFKLEDAREVLSSTGIQGLTVAEVKGFGRRKGHTGLYRGAEYNVNFLSEMKIDVAIADDRLNGVIDVISKATYTGKIGDGKIFVAELQRVVHIRTGEVNEATLQLLAHGDRKPKNEDSNDENGYYFTGTTAGAGDDGTGDCE